MRHAQRKVIKYHQLVTNLVILHNVEAMTRVLKEIQAEGFVVDAAVLGGLALYRIEHINRFGDYSLDLERQVPPMQFETILILNQSVTSKNAGFRRNPGRPSFTLNSSGWTLRFFV